MIAGKFAIVFKSNHDCAVHARIVAPNPCDHHRYALTANRQFNKLAQRITIVVGRNLADPGRHLARLWYDDVTDQRKHAAWIARINVTCQQRYRWAGRFEANALPGQELDAANARYARNKLLHWRRQVCGFTVTAGAHEHIAGQYVCEPVFQRGAKRDHHNRDRRRQTDCGDDRCKTDHCLAGRGAQLRETKCILDPAGKRQA